MEASSHATDLGVNAAEGSCASCTSVGLAIFNNGINNPIDLGIREGVPSAVAKPTQRLEANCTDDRVMINDEFLETVRW